MWYVGTKTNCEAYNEMVSKAMGLTGNMTSAWANVRRHPSKSLFAIVAHPAHEADNLTPYDVLPDSWTPVIEEL